MTDTLTARRIPEGAELTRRTPDFTAQTVPAGLLADHSTKADTWGLLVVTSGQVRFSDAESGLSREVKAGESQAILPQSLHSVAPAPDALFHVAFYRLPE